VFYRTIKHVIVDTLTKLVSSCSETVDMVDISSKEKLKDTKEVIRRSNSKAYRKLYGEK